MLNISRIKVNGVTYNITGVEVYSKDSFFIYGNAVEGPSVSFTDSRIDNEHWVVQKVEFGTPENVSIAADDTWTTDISTGTLTLNADFLGETTVTVTMSYVR